MAIPIEKKINFQPMISEKVNEPSLEKSYVSKKNKRCSLWKYKSS